MSADLLAEDAVTTPLEDDRPDELWHLAADDFHDRRAEMGMTWLTLCGQMRPPAVAARDAWGSSDDCPICEARTDAEEVS